MIIACPWCEEGSGNVLVTAIELDAGPVEADGLTVTVKLSDLEPVSIAHVKLRHPEGLASARYA